MADDRAEIAVRAVINERGDVTPLDGMVQRHGAASWDGKKIVWNPDPDDRLLMHVNPWVLDKEALLA